MSDDLIEDAIDCLRGEGWDNEADAVDRSVAEIKRLREEMRRSLRIIAEYEDNVTMSHQQLTAKDIRIQQLRETMENLREYGINRDSEIAAKDALNNDLMANCNQLRDRCWKAEGELARWQKIAIDEKATLLSFAAMISPPMPEELVGFYLNKAKESKNKKIHIAASELNLQATQEAEYAERLSDAFLKLYEMQLPTMDPETRKRHAQAALDKIREGK